MAYCITGFSFVPKYCPVFEAINADGSPFQYKSIIAPNGIELKGIWNLDSGFRLTDEMSPSLDSVYRLARLMRGRKTKTLPDIFALPGPVPCINQAVRDCIESLEPGVHQFFPITLLHPNMDTVFDGRFYILNVCKLLNSIILQASNLRIINAHTPYSYVQTGLNHPDFRAVQKSVIDGSHLWREQVYLRDIYISDCLYREFRDRKLKGIDKHHYVEAVEL
jgi:hypothetical protein